MNLEKGVGIDHCYKKQDNKMQIIHEPAMANLCNRPSMPN